MKEESKVIAKSAAWLHLILIAVLVAFAAFSYNLHQSFQEIQQNLENQKSELNKTENFKKLNEDQIKSELKTFQGKSEPKTTQEKSKPTYILFDHNGPNSEIIKNVGIVLDRLGFQQIELQSLGLRTENISMDWDLFWSWLHLSQTKLDYSKLKPYQKVNHWPGNYALASKVTLATQTDSKYIPKAFLTVESVREYAKDHPGKKFLTKFKTSRGIKLINPNDMNFVPSQDNEGYFAQEFIKNPLLWNGRKFDFAFFVVITSVNPLRLYYFEKNFLIRVASKNYSMEDPEDLDSYLVSRDYIRAEHFEPIKKVVSNETFSYRTAFDMFIKSKGVDPDEIWVKVEDLIRTIVMIKEKIIIDEVEKFGTSTQNHFELFRFDMLLDENFNLYLIEINMSPSLVGRADRPLNIQMHENVLYNLFNMIGVGTMYEKSSLKFDPELTMMVTYPNGIGVKPEICLSDDCLNCGDEKCELCWQCMDENSKNDLIRAYSEQINIGEFKRLFPPEKEFIEKADEEFWKNLSNENKKHVTWYLEMCKRNKKFC